MKTTENKSFNNTFLKVCEYMSKSKIDFSYNNFFSMEGELTQDIQKQLISCVRVKESPPGLSYCCAILSSEAAEIIERDKIDPL
jgi:hypothetical protein